MLFHVVDDNKFIREFVDELLQEQGYATKLFECPQKYIDYVKSSDYKKPVAVFTDITMPIMNGYEMIESISELVSGMRFIVMTGEPGIRSEHMDKPCMYLSKPFNPSSITGVIDKLMKCHNSEPSCKHHCNRVDDRKLFPLKNWSCPNTCKECS